MSVELFTDGREPDNPDAVVWRFLNMWKFEDFIGTGELFFNRADRFPQDDLEGLPPNAYRHAPGLHPLDINDMQDTNNAIASIAQFRESFYVNCWYLFDEERASMWQEYGADGVAIASRYSLLKAALEPIPDRPHLGLVRYGSKHLTGWNTQRFITTKREEFAHEREVRALLWIMDPFAGGNRHFDINNRAYDRPLTPPPPDRVKDFHRRSIDVQALVTGIVVSPYAAESRLAEVEKLIRSEGYTFPARRSDLARFPSVPPPADADLRKYFG